MWNKSSYYSYEVFCIFWKKILLKKEYILYTRHKKEHGRKEQLVLSKRKASKQKPFCCSCIQYNDVETTWGSEIENPNYCKEALHESPLLFWKVEKIFLTKRGMHMTAGVFWKIDSHIHAVRLTQIETFVQIVSYMRHLRMFWDFFLNFQIHFHEGTFCMLCLKWPRFTFEDEKMRNRMVFELC